MANPCIMAILVWHIFQRYAKVAAIILKPHYIRSYDDVVVHATTTTRKAVLNIHTVFCRSEDIHDIDYRSGCVLAGKEIKMKSVDVIYHAEHNFMFKVDNPWWNEGQGGYANKYSYYKRFLNGCGTIEGGVFTYEWAWYTKILVDFDLTKRNEYIVIQHGSGIEHYTVTDCAFVMSVSVNGELLWEYDVSSGSIFVRAAIVGGVNNEINIFLQTLNDEWVMRRYIYRNNVWHLLGQDGSLSQVSNVRSGVLLAPTGTGSSGATIPTPNVYILAPPFSGIPSFLAYRIMLDTVSVNIPSGYTVERFGTGVLSQAIYKTNLGYVFDGIVLPQGIFNLSGHLPFIVILRAQMVPVTLHYGTIRCDQTYFYKCQVDLRLRLSCSPVNDRSLILYMFPLSISNIPDTRFYSVEYNTTLFNKALRFRPKNFFAFSLVDASVQGAAPLDGHWLEKVDVDDDNIVIDMVVSGRKQTVKLNKHKSTPMPPT